MAVTATGPGCSAQGVLGHQDKLMMTRFEREQWDIAPGQGLRCSTLPWGGLAF
jgi:predicted amidohydrolase